MQYPISHAISRSAAVPHSWFILNLILTHIFAFLIIMEIGTAVHAIIIPFVSLLILGILWRVAIAKQHSADWFVAAHWLIMIKRSKILIIAYIIGITIGGLAWVALPTLKGQTGNLVPYFLTGVPIFFGLLITFVLSGSSIFDAQRGIVNNAIVSAFPPPADWLIQHPAVDSQPTKSTPA